MGAPTQVAGVSSETPAATATNGFTGWSPEANRATYTVGSGSSVKKGTAEVADTTTRRKQFYR